MNQYAYDSGGGRGFMMGGSLSSAVRMLMAWNVILFLVQVLFPYRLETTFGLVPARVWDGWAWQLLTYMFLHGGFMHLAFNMLALFLFGFQLEALWGTRNFVKFYFFCGIGGGLLTILTSSPSLQIPTIGASGAIWGLLLAYGVTYPDRPILVSFIIPMPAKYFVMIFGLMELLFSISGSRSGVAHWAHVGGLVSGWIYLKGIPMLRRSRRRRRQQRNFRVLEFKEPEDESRRR